MIEQLSSEYIITLRAKGLPERVIIYKHALKNGIIPVMTIAAMQFGSLIVGAVLVESIFSLNGLGQLLVQAVLVGDTAVIQGVSIIVIVVFQLANLVVDALYAVIDPRIRQEQVA
jgi:peptide/nickel transport system permease protein